ncbi:Phosphoserine phosphatase 1 [Ruegeria sp. THAF57]|uniref:histidine phosphatase family protein n=1 Tax=Ruegeria sp. THAF57 TaxID=2744555 RepID=UPI0015DF6D6B|nr:histidine phosphatase family protein [Ruegeria sp. THAF57]CAD0186787.1 Phosphoserine phosphatase 1 [Ruegeria sp. THAF57]
MINHPELFILRHGETVWNREGKLQGRKDSPLTPTGIAQAEIQKKLLGQIDRIPSDIFVSPLGRAMHTARLVLGSERDFCVDDRLQEISFGQWEGQTRQEIRQRSEGDISDDDLSFGSPDGENFEMIAGRVKAFLSDLKRPAIVVTHGATASVMRGLCTGLDRAGMVSLVREQGCIFHLRNGQERILRVSNPD